MSRQIEEQIRHAIAALQRGDWQQTEKLCGDALARAPSHPTVLHVLGVLRLRQGKAGAALELLGRVSAMQPADPQVLADLGAALEGSGRKSEALVRYRAALSSDPRHPEALYRLAVALNAENAFTEAISYLERFLSAAPDHLLAITEMGIALQGLGRHEEAERHFRDVVERSAGSAWAHYHLAGALAAQNRFDDAIASLDQALALQPDYGEAWNARGAARQNLGKFDEAVADYRRALALQRDYADAELNLATALLYRGDFSEGWLRYEARFDTVPPRVARRDLPSPRVTRETLRATTVAVCAEQGLGDKILYSSIIPELVSERINFVYEVDQRMLAIYRRSFPGQEFVGKQDPPAQPLIVAGAHTPAASLFGMLRGRREDFLRQPKKLLASDPVARAGFRARLEALGPDIAVAVSWRSALGRHQRLVQARKSATLGAFSCLGRIPGVRLVDVQYGETTGERQAFARDTGAEIARMEEVDHLNDIESVLAIIDACDLVITTSNVTAHFAGALGKPTWLLYLANRPPFFYWADAGGGRSLWYPSIEILSGPEITRWDDLLERAQSRLQDRIAGGFERGRA